MFNDNENRSTGPAEAYTQQARVEPRLTKHRLHPLDMGFYTNPAHAALTVSLRFFLLVGGAVVTLPIMFYIFGTSLSEVIEAINTVSANELRAAAANMTLFINDLFLIGALAAIFTFLGTVAFQTLAFFKEQRRANHNQ